jgi:hypothetical protein
MAREGGLTAQLRAIARAVEVLPEVRDYLMKLDVGVAEMTDEVRRMRKGVDDLGQQIRVLNGSVEGLDEHFIGLRYDMSGVEGHLKEVRKALDPLQRALGNIGRLGGRLRGPAQ